MRKKSIAINITSKCNAKCKICCYGCSPDNNDVIDERLMLHSINRISDLGGIDSLCFSGGEPFLFFDLLKKGLKYAKDKGFKTSVATNGYWGMWPKDEIKSKLEELSVDLIRISTDEYHLECIPEKDIRQAIETVKTLKTELKIGIGETAAGKACGDFFRLLGSYKYLLSFYTYAFEKTGRADELPAESFYTSDKAGFYPDLLSIRYDGEVFIGKNQLRNENRFSSGNIKISSLSEILSKERYQYEFLESGIRNDR